jgi:hypothetical protein
MIKKKAGIFDPWRQERPPPPPEPVPVSLEESGDAAMPFRFAGRRGGVIVWLPRQDEKKALPQAKTNILAALLKLLADPSLFPIFRTRGISTDTTDTSAERYLTHLSDGVRTVVIRGNYDDAVDAITFAFREAMRTKESVTPYLTSLGIRPYIK